MEDGQHNSRVTNSLPTGTVTFLFTDIEGSTQLLHQLRAGYAELLAEHHHLLREVFIRHNGREVDTHGDAFFVVFPRASDAVNAVVAAQRALAQHAWPSHVVVRVRMGLHTGEPMQAVENYVGMDVHRSARIADVGHGGQVLLSETTAALILGELPDDVDVLDLGRHLLKDMSRPEHIRQLVIQGLPAEFPPLKSLEKIPSLESRLPRAVGACPYQGLAAFQEHDAAFFFGREAFVERLLTAVKTHPLVAVIVGSSGSGKSSTIFAGLLPQLREEERWTIVQFRPGSRPFTAMMDALLQIINPGLPIADHMIQVRQLADAIKAEDLSLYDVINQVFEHQRNHDHLLLVIDQFEELYTLCQLDEVRMQFKDELLAVVKEFSGQRQKRSVLLITMRADFMGQALNHRPFADTLQDASLLMGPMTRDELREVVQRPAEMQGAIFEAGLVERLLDDVGERPGNLPLLEFALTLLWEEQQDGWLTHADYEAIGGVDGALARYADEAFTDLQDDEQERARRVFVQLVKPGEGTEDTRRVAIRKELAEEDWGLVQHLADRRLVVTGRDTDGNETVEVVHEALIQRWRRFREWMQEDRAFRSWQDRLRTSLRVWETSGKDEKALLRGLPLTEAHVWLLDREDDLSIQERGYIQASMNARKQREQAEIAQKEYELSLEKRSGRFLRVLVGVFVLASIVSVVLTVDSRNQRRIAEQEAHASLKAFSLSLAAHAQKSLDDAQASSALALALIATELADAPAEAQRVLRQAAYSPGPRKRIDVQEAFGEIDGKIYSLAVSPVEHISLAGFSDGTLILWDMETQEEIRRFMGHTDLVRDIAFSSDGKRALTGSNDQLMILWDVETGEEIRRFEGHNGWVRAVGFSPDGRLAASGGFVGDSWEAVVNPGEMILWDLETATEIHHFDGYPSGVQDLAFSPDGTLILASSGLDMDRTVPKALQLRDVATGELKLDIPVDHDNFSLTFSPDGDTALTATNLHDIYVWDMSTGKKIQTLEGHQALVTSVAVTPDGGKAISGDWNGRVILWDLQSSSKILQAKVHEADGFWSVADPAPMNVAVGPNGQKAVSSSGDGYIVLWDLFNAGQVRTFQHPDYVWSVALTPDGTRMLTGVGPPLGSTTYFDTAVRLWDTATGEELHALEGHPQTVMQIVASRDGSKALSGGAAGDARLWDLRSGEEIQTFWGYPDGVGVFAVGISPDSRSALTGSYTYEGLIQWDLESGERLFEAKSGTNFTTIQYTPDGRIAYSAGGGDDFNGLFLWDLETGKVLRRYSDGNCCTGFAIHPDGKRAYTVGIDGILREWDLEADREKRQFGDHDGYRSRVEVSDDGQRLVSSSWDGTIYLWDVETGIEIRHFSNGVNTLDIDMTPDGKYLITPGPCNTAILWNLDLPTDLNEVIDWIEENRFVRDLTCVEREAYSIEPLCESTAAETE